MRHKLILLWLVSVHATSGTYSQWVQTNGPSSMNVVCMTARGTSVFAGTWEDSLFRTDNGGQTWVRSNSGLIDSRINTLAAGGTFVYAGTQNAGIFRSSNNGTSWLAANPDGEISSIYALETVGTDVYAAGMYGVWRSTNNGATWVGIAEGLPAGTRIWSFAVSGTTVFAGGIGDGLFRSSNNGSTWQPVNSGLTNGYVVALLIVDGYVFASTYAGVFRSTNNGDSWSQTTLPATLAGGFATAPRNTTGNNLFVVAAGSVYLSTDDGEIWTQVNSGLPSSLVRSLTINGPDIFAGTDDAGVWRRPLSEMIGTAVPNLVQNPGFESGKEPWKFYTNGSGTFATNVGGDGSIHAARLDITNPGSNVQLYQAGIPLEAGTRYRLRFTAYSNTGHDLRAFIHKDGFPYTNYGLDQWTSDLGTFYHRYSMEFTAKNFSGSAADARLRFWLAPYAAAGDRYVIDDVVLEKVEGYPGVQPDVILNGGFESGHAPWEFYTNGAGSFGTDAAGKTTAHAGHIRIGAPGSNVQLFQQGLELQAGVRYVLRFKAYSTLGHDMTVNLHKHCGPYTNYGLAGWVIPLSTSWAPYTMGFTACNFIGTTRDGRIRFWLAPYATAGDEYFIDDVSLTKEGGGPGKGMSQDIASEKQVTPQTTALFQNFPNPFNPVTSIRFTLATRQMTTIQVFDLLGREVETLIDEVREPGTYTVQFDASRLPSGVYFYRMRAGAFVQTERLTLVK